MQPTFFLLVVLMTGIAIFAVALPVLRARSASGAGQDAGRWLTISILGVLVSATVLVSYPRLTNFEWSSVETAQAVRAATESAAGSGGGATDIVESLAQRLRTQGGSIEEWRLLGRSYFNLSRFDDAQAAFREAYRQSAGGDPTLVAELSAEYAEAMILSDQRALLGEAGALLEQSLAVLPDNPRALWWSGLGAFERGQYATSQARWERLLASPQMAEQNEMRAVLEQRIAMAQQLGAQNAPPPAQLREAMAAAQGAEALPDVQAPASEPPPAQSLQVLVQLAPDLEQELAEDRVLFVIARTPGGGGPPLAVVRRRSSELPFEVALSDADAMIPGRGISSVAQVEVVARISASGNPIASPGDLWGSQQVPVQAGDQITVTIDQVTR